MNHVPFVISAYAITLIALSGFAIWLIMQSRRTKRRLTQLEQRLETVPKPHFKRKP